MMNDYKFNKLLSDTITLPILPANKFTNTDTEYYTVLEKNYIPIESSIICIYKPDWITGYKFTTEDRYYNRLSITSINDNTEKKLRKGIMEFAVSNNIPADSSFISGINHIYAKVSQAPHEEIDVRLEFIPTEQQKTDGLTNKENWIDKNDKVTEHIIGGKISGDEQELHIKYYGILNDINQSNVTLLINDKQLDTSNIKSLRTTVQNEIDLIYLIDENINTVTKNLKFSVIFKTTYNSMQRDYYITQGFNNYVIKLGIDSINNTNADDILYQGETKKLIYTFSLNNEYKQSDDLDVHFEFINNTYELNYQTGITSYIDNQYNLNLIINPNYTLQERKVKVYVIYKNKIKSNEIVITQKYDTDMKLYYEIDDEFYDSPSVFKVTPFGKDISLYYYARTSDGQHIITSMSNIKYIDNTEITEYYEINYTRTNDFDYNNIKDINEDSTDKKILYLQFPLLTEFINPEIYINISLFTLTLNNITFIQQHFDTTQTKVNINEKLSTDKIGGIPQFSEIKLVFNAVNVYGNEKSTVIDSNLFDINFYQKNQDKFISANSLFDLENIEYETTKDTDDFLIAQNIRLKNEYYNVNGNREFYYQISYILGNTEINRTDYIKITQESLQYECKLVSDTNIISFEGNSNFIVKGYGILYNNQEEKNKGASSNAYYTTYLTSALIDGSSDNILNSQIKLVNTSDYTNIKLDIKNIDNTNVNNNQRIRNLIIRGKYRYNTNSNIEEDTLTLQQTYIKLNLELYSNSSLDDQLTYNNQTGDNYIIENILQDTVLYFKYYMQESIIENGKVKLVNVYLKNYSSDLTINLNNTNSLTLWTQNNLMPYTSNIIYNEDEDYYYGCLNIPKNLLACDNKIILKYIQKYKDIDYAYTQFVLYKDKVYTLYDDATQLYTTSNDKYAYISHYRINDKEAGISSTSSNTSNIVVYNIDTTKVKNFIIYYNVIYQYRDISKRLIDTTFENFYYKNKLGIFTPISNVPYYTTSEQSIEKVGNINYIGQEITMNENINNVSSFFIFYIHYQNNYKESSTTRVIWIYQKEATRAYNLSYLVDDPTTDIEDNETPNNNKIYGIRHKDGNIYKKINNYYIYCDPYEQILHLYLGLYCNDHIDLDYKQPFDKKTGEIKGNHITIKKDDIYLSSTEITIPEGKEPSFNDTDNYYEFTVQLSDITSETENTTYSLYYERNYTYYDYNTGKSVNTTTRSNQLYIKRFAYNTTNYTLYIGFYDKDGNKITSISNNKNENNDIIYIHYYLTKADDKERKNKLDLSKIKYDFTLKLGNENISIDLLKITKSDDNIYSYPYAVTDNIAENERNLVATVSINNALTESASLKQKGSTYSVIIHDNTEFIGKTYTEEYRSNGKQITQILYFKGGLDKSFDNELTHYNITCDDPSVILSDKEQVEDKSYFKVTVTIPENSSTTSEKTYTIIVKYLYSNITQIYISSFLIYQGSSKINAVINLTEGAADGKINNAGETITLECYGELNGDEKADGELTCSDSSITIPEPEISGTRYIYNIEIGISSTDRTLKFTFTYKFHDSQTKADKTLSQGAGDFELFVHAYYMRDSTKVEDDMEELALQATDTGYFYLQYYAQVKNGTYIDTDQSHYKITYEKYNDGDMTYEYPVDFKTEETSLKDNKLELKCKFSQNPKDSDYDYERCVNFTIKYNIGSVENKTMLINQASAFAIGLASFDFLLFEYIFIDKIGRSTVPSEKNTQTGYDLDTITHITNNKNIKMSITSHNKTYTLNNVTMGFSQTLYSSGNYWKSSQNYIEYDDILGFSGDNISGSQESIFINMKEILAQISNTLLENKCKYVYIDLYGHMYTTLCNGRVKVTYRTFKNKGSNPSITLDRSTEKYIFNTTDTEVNKDLAKTYDLTVQEANLKSSYTWLARLTYNVKTGSGQLDSRNLYGYQKRTDNELTVFNRTYADKNSACFYINSYKQYDDTITLKTINISYSERSTDTSTYDFSSYLCSSFNGNNSVGVHWQYFNSFSVTESNKNGINCSFDRLTFKFNIKQTYESYSWPAEADRTREVIVNTDPAYDNIKFIIKIIEQKYTK